MVQLKGEKKNPNTYKHMFHAMTFIYEHKKIKGKNEQTDIVYKLKKKKKNVVFLRESYLHCRPMSEYVNKDAFVNFPLRISFFFCFAFLTYDHLFVYFISDIFVFLSTTSSLYEHTPSIKWKHK